MNKLKAVVATLRDKDLRFCMIAYNGLKENANMLNGAGMGTAEMKKVHLIKRLTNTGYNLQKMAINSLKEFLVSERDLDDQRQAEYERQQKEKDRILRRIMNSNLRFAGMGFRQAFQFMEAEREREIVLINKQRGIMRRI